MLSDFHLRSSELWALTYMLANPVLAFTFKLFGASVDAFVIALIGQLRKKQKNWSLACFGFS